MKKRGRLALAASLALISAVSLILADGFKNIKEQLRGEEEVPVISTEGKAEFRARINNDASEISYELSYSDLEGAVQQAHIHIGQKDVNGGISVFLCSNLPLIPVGPTPPGTQPCPASPASITGTLTAANVIGPANQGVAAGEFAELIDQMRKGNTYVNVHSSKFPGGEVRSQIHSGGGGH